MSCCPNAPHPRMAPGQAPYTCEELGRVASLVSDAAASDPGELAKPVLARCGRHHRGITCPACR